MLPNTDHNAPTAGQRPIAGMLRPDGRADHPGGDGLVHVGGLALAALAALLLATAAAAIGLAAYGLITWRRARWWPPVLLGAILGLVAMAALGGPGPTLHRHLLAARELTLPARDCPGGKPCPRGSIGCDRRAGGNLAGRGTADADHSRR